MSSTRRGRAASFERIYVPELDVSEQDTLDALAKKLHDKQPRNLLRACYYDGKRALRQVGSVIPPQYYRLALTLGWAAKAVDALSRRCNLDGLQWAAGDLPSLGFDEVWNGNRCRTELGSGTHSSLLHGTAFLVNTQGDETAGEIPGLIHVKDAFDATGTWNARRRALSDLLSITSRDDDGKPDALALYLDDLTIIVERDGGKWVEVDRSEHTWGVPAEPLVYKPEVRRPFGHSRISRVTMSMHDQALRTLIRTEGHADVFSFPQMVLLGADERIFKNADGTVKASWQVVLGRIFGIPDDEDAENPRADVKQFLASSPQPHIDLYSQQAKAFAGEHDIPVSSLGVAAETNTTTEDGSNNAERNLIAEAEGATDEWTPPIVRAISRAMAMANGLTEIPKEWQSIEAKWRSPAFLSRAAQADAGAKQLGAVPWLAETEVGLELLGLTDAQIKRALNDRRRMGGSAALRAITDRAAAAAAPVDEAAAIKAKADAMGVLIRSGVDPDSAAERVGLAGVKFTGAVPVSLRLPASDANSLEGGSAPVGSGA